MLKHPLHSVGMVVQGTGTSRAFTGTCFAFRDPRFFLTATHCAKPDAPALRVATILHPTVEYLTVNAVHRHPAADLAILEVQLPPDTHIPAYWNAVSDYKYGEDRQAFGFPEDVFGASRGTVTARMFRGYIQRTLGYASPMGFRYEAAELSFGAPGGLSGGPVFRPGAPQMIIGVVTENLQSTTFLEAVEDKVEGGIPTRTKYQSVINYGVALLVDKVEAWIDTIVPVRGSYAIG